MPLDPLEETGSLSNSYYYWCDMLVVTWGVGIESDQLCWGNRELPGIGYRVVSGSRLWESLVTEVGKHFLTYTVRALLAECLVSLSCPKLNKIIIVFRKSISCLRFSLSESKDSSGQCLEREKSLSQWWDPQVSLLVQGGDGSCGWPWRPFCFSNISQPTGCSSKPETVCGVWMLPP